MKYFMAIVLGLVVGGCAGAIMWAELAMFDEKTEGQCLKCVALTLVLKDSIDQTDRLIVIAEGYKELVDQKDPNEAIK